MLELLETQAGSGWSTVKWYEIQWFLKFCPLHLHFLVCTLNDEFLIQFSTEHCFKLKQRNPGAISYGICSIAKSTQHFCRPLLWDKTREESGGIPIRDHSSSRNFLRSWIEGHLYRHRNQRRRGRLSTLSPIEHINWQLLADFVTISARGGIYGRSILEY